VRTSSVQDIRFNDYIKQPDTTAIDFDAWLSTLNNVLRQTDQANLRSLQTQPSSRISRTADLPALRDTSTRASTLNALESDNFNRRFNPEGEKARELLSSRVLADAEEGPNQDLSNLWKTMGLEESIATGANLDGGFARSALVDSTRRNYTADRDRRTAALAGLAEANPYQTIGLAPEFAVGREVETAMINDENTDRTRKDVDNWRQQQRVNERSAISDLMGVVQSFMQTSAAQKTEDLSARRDYDQQRLDWDIYMAQLDDALRQTPYATGRNSSLGTMGALTGAATGALSGATAGSAAGPYGTLAGALIGGAVGGFSGSGALGSQGGQLAGAALETGAGLYGSYSRNAARGGGSPALGNAIGNFQYYTGSTPRATAIR
jgi:hypothetical protein